MDIRLPDLGVFTAFTETAVALANCVILPKFLRKENSPHFTGNCPNQNVPTIEIVVVDTYFSSRYNNWRVIWLKKKSGKPYAVWLRTVEAMSKR